MFPIGCGEACGAVANRPSMGGTPTDSCPCSPIWWGAPEKDPYAQPTPAPHTADSMTEAATVQSWWENHRARWLDLQNKLDEVLLNPVSGLSRPRRDDFVGPPVRLLCPRGHMVDDVQAVCWWDGEGRPEDSWRLRSILRATVHDRDKGLTIAAPLKDRPRGQWEEVGLRNHARCRNRRCKYDGRHKLEDLLRLYAVAVATGQRQVPLPS